MKLRKKIKSWGASKGILFDREDVELLNLEAGEFVEIEVNKDLDWKRMKQKVAEQDVIERTK